jgi:hypothetical protein
MVKQKGKKKEKEGWWDWKGGVGKKGEESSPKKRARLFIFDFFLCGKH